MAGERLTHTEHVQPFLRSVCHVCVSRIAHFRVLTFLETGPEFGRESEASCEVRLAGAKIKRDR